MKAKAKLKGRKIVLAEDNQTIRENLAERLTRKNFKVFTAENGFTARELVKREKPYALVTDHNMPDMTGFELVRELRKEHISIPAIINTDVVSIERIKDHLSEYVKYETNRLLELLESF